MKRYKDFDIDGEVFQDFRDQMQTAITQTISEMQRRNITGASVTGKIDITLISDNVQDPDTGALREVKIPMLNTQAKVAMKLTRESDVYKYGSMDEELVWNSESQNWSTRTIQKSQQSLFEDGYDYAEEPNG